MMPRTRLLPDRRELLLAGLALAVSTRAAPASAWPDDLTAAVAGFAAGARLQEGRVTLDIAELVDNGNAVPVTLHADSPMTPADHVVAMALFNERNPQRDVFVARLGPHSGRARVSTRIRLATSQQLIALARMNDGSCWMRSVEVIVTLAACIEEPGTS